MIAIAFAGDLVPTPANAAFFESGEVERVFDQELLGALLAADARVVNLEAPLYVGDTPIFKAGPALSAPTGATRGLMRLGAPIVSLANNHILDHGARGLESTLDALSAAGLTHLSAGANLAEAGRPYIYRKGRRANRADRLRGA